MQGDCTQTTEDIAPDWQNAVEMIRAAGYVHPAEVIETLAADNERLRSWLQNIVDVYDAASELFTSDRDLAASIADRARAALAGRTMQRDA